MVHHALHWSLDLTLSKPVIIVKWRRRSQVRVQGSLPPAAGRLEATPEPSASRHGGFAGQALRALDGILLVAEAPGRRILSPEQRWVWTIGETEDGLISINAERYPVMDEFHDT